MKKNDLYKKGDKILRVLKVKDDQALVVECISHTVPRWCPAKDVIGELCTEESLRAIVGFEEVDEDDLDRERRKVMYQRFTVIAGVLPYMADNKARNDAMDLIAKENGITKQTIRIYMCKYLALQSLQALLPKERETERELTADEKNMRWSLNKFFYTSDKNSLPKAYEMMLKAKYCDEAGKLKTEYPTFFQFRYFYRKTRKMQNYYISRDGLSNYQRNNRPCTGDGIHEYAPAPGVGMVDATPCDIYLVNESGQVVGRPILTACIDAYSGLCCGYSLSWEGGVYSLRNLMLNVIDDKAAHCRKLGIKITEDDWINTDIPGRIVSDQGSEYIGHTFEQMAELGVTIVNLPSYRPELKGIVEKFFDLIQDSFKPYLKGKGVIDPDFQERGAHDYRKDACLTIDEFEQIILRCIIHYNSKRVIENYPYTEEMLDEGIEPYANDLIRYGMNLPGSNWIRASKEQIVLTLLPRVEGKFSRYGLKVNKLRYKHDGYTEAYLNGKTVPVAYDPDDVSHVWMIENGRYIRFELIESRFEGKDVDSVGEIQEKQRQMVKAQEHSKLQASVDLANHIQSIVSSAEGRKNQGIKGISKVRKKEELRTHKEYAKEVGLHGTN